MCLFYMNVRIVIFALALTTKDRLSNVDYNMHCPFETFALLKVKYCDVTRI